VSAADRILTPLVLVAERVGLAERTLRTMAAEGRFPAVRIGRKWMVSEKALARWLREAEQACEDNVVPMRRRA
jgi:excisionase family DNA binding protein